MYQIYYLLINYINKTKKHKTKNKDIFSIFKKNNKYK